MINNIYAPPVIPSNAIDFKPNYQSSLDLRQLKDYQITNEFTDSLNNRWRLVKSAYDSSVEIPDPNYVQVVDYWVHEFPNSDGKVFVYCVQGIKRPKIDTEKPTQIIYQWFSTVNNPQFTPMMITQTEWCKANIYMSQLNDSRLSVLNAFCGIKQEVKQVKQSEDIPLNLINGKKR